MDQQLKNLNGNSRLCICLEILGRLRLRNDSFPVFKYKSIFASPWAASLDDEEHHQRLFVRSGATLVQSR